MSERMEMAAEPSSQMKRRAICRVWEEGKIPYDKKEKNAKKKKKKKKRSNNNERAVNNAEGGYAKIWKYGQLSRTKGFGENDS